MGSRPPAPPPTPPTPAPSTPYGGQVWFTSNVATPDMLNLFTEPHLWPAGQARINTIKFYGQQLFADDPSQCGMCENNIFSNFVGVDAFRRLKEWGKEIAIEMGSVKPHDCTADVNIRLTEKIIDRLKSVDSKLRYISMDEPYTSGMDSCRLAGEAVSDHVAKYIKKIQSYFSEKHPGENLDIGLIEAYPHMNVDQITWFLQLLKERDATPGHFHVDFDFWAARNKKMSNAQIGNDLRRMEAKCRELGIPFGILLWGHDGDNAGKFSQDLIELANKVKSTFGRPDVIVFQSWSGTKTGDRRIVPSNLTEANPASLMGTMKSVLEWF